MPVLYADIVVDISAGSLDRIFQYRIPDVLTGSVDIGSQVKIPFGRGDKALTGYVVNITEEPGYDIDKIKDISQVINSELAMEGQLIKLAWQIKKVYGGTMNQALKTVVPVKKQIKAVVRRQYRLAVTLEEAKKYLSSIQENKRYKARVRLLDALIYGSVQAPETKSGAGGVPEQNKAMEQSCVQGQTGTTKQSGVPEQRGAPAAGRLLPQSYIEDFLKISPSTVRSLIEAGYVEEVAEEEYRSPWRHLMPQGGPVELNEEQDAAVAQILSDTTHQIHLIHGVTGSGKTEVYMELIARTIALGKQAIVLIPEISLSLQTVSRFHSRFGDRVSIMNSRLSDGEKYDQYLRAKRGDIDIVVGPRSALFMPLKSLGLIVMDEEHDGAYKSETTPRFHARDVAAWRAQMTGAKLVLGSATPSMETYARALSGLYSLHELTQRAKAGSVLPEVTVVDLREEFKLKNKKIFSGALREMIKQRLDRHEQVILFLNRRGYAGFVSCRSCGHVFKCRHCEVSMTAHNNGWLKCHYCGYEEKLPKVCPECGSPYVAAFGTGTQKVERLVMDEFPQARVLRLDRDSTAKKDSMDEILERFRSHEADILVGTQMIVKGHDFPNVTLVGILAADLSMFSNDFMAAERTFQLLTQAAGRSGRDEKGGQVVIQTYNPDHYSIVCASRQDYKEFYRQEIQYRRMLGYPPAKHMMVVLVQSPDEEKASAFIGELLKAARRYCSQANLENMEFIGPASASVSKGKDTYRKVFYVKNKRFPYLIAVREYMESYGRENRLFKDVSLQFDVNPMSMY